MTATATGTASQGRAWGWAIVGGREIRDLWVGGRGLLLSLAFSVLLSIVAYLVAANQALNFLEQRESVSLTLQVAVAVGSLLTLLAAADSISGERERATLESLLLTPVARLGITSGKLLGALSLWFAAFAITIPYVWFLGRGIGLVGDAIATGLVIGTLLAVFLSSLGMIISVFASSNRVSLSVGLFILLALFAPTQFPISAQQGWGETLLRVNPITAGEHYIDRILVNEDGWTDNLSWLVSPIVGAVVFASAAVFVGARYLRLGAGGR